MEEDSSLNQWFQAKPELLRKTQWLILWRLVFSAFILLLTVLFQEKRELPGPFPYGPLYFLIALQFCFSLVYILALFRLQVVRTIAIGQLLIDGLIVSGLVLVTGGLESFWFYLYFLIILASGILFYRRGGALMAGYLSFLYGLMLLLQYQGILADYLVWYKSFSSYRWGNFSYQWGMATAGFFLAGYLGSFFSEQSYRQRTELIAQRINIDELAEINQLIIHHLDMGLITLDSGEHILSVNPAGEAILGQATSRLKSRPVREILPGLQHIPGWPKLAQGERFEVDYQHPDGQTLYLGFSVTYLREGQPIGLEKIITFKDLTQIHEMEDHLRQMDRLAMMGQMAAGIVHEIKNPLASISGSIQMIREELKEDGPGDRLINLVSREVEKLDTLLHDFITFARPSQPSEKGVDLGEVIPGTIELIQKNKGLAGTIQWELNLEPNLVLKMPPNELSQILWNLLTNALHSVPERGHIWLSGRRLKEGRFRDGVEIRIRDDGPGIPEAQLKRIFEPFFTTKEKGLGLGLSIVQKLVSQHQGIIKVNSSGENGTEFILIFPLPLEKALTAAD
jgi:two-component system sensor histidine kinase PilS (NtrC family)